MQRTDLIQPTALGLLAGLLGCCCVPAAAAEAPPHGVQLTATLADHCRLQVDNPAGDPGAGACWSRHCPDQSVRTLGCGWSAMLQVSELLPSPDGRWLAVVSVGEGHPLLEVIALDRLQASEPVYQVVRLLNPFPSTLDLVDWQATGLRLSSDVCLSGWPQPDGADAARLLPDWRLFQLAPPDWQVRALEPAADCR